MVASAQPMEVGLVLQGGGALGAYEYGGIECLLELIEAAAKKRRRITLKIVTGVSIGAINAACVIGAASLTDARERLAALWNELAVDTPSFIPSSISSNLALWNVQHFYALRPDLLTWPTWTYVYDTHPMLGTLKKHVDFAALNRSEIAFIITAVDVESGKLTPFSNRDVGDATRTTITPDHVLASGSLAPQFPWTDISIGGKQHHYWDGGIVDNTPLGYAIDGFSDEPEVTRILVVMNLFPVAAKLPHSLAEVNDRINQLRFGSRLRQDTKAAETINGLLSTIDALRGQITGPLPPEIEQQVDRVKSFKAVKTFEIELAGHSYSEDDYGFRDFSRDGIEKRRKRGHALTLAKLGHVIQ
jgi:predicted acylesterase/phospholipase RssA